MSHHHHAEKHEPRELAVFLKANTRATHQSVDDLVMSVQPFSTPANYTRFLQLQAVFHKIVDDVYKNPTLNQHIDGLAALARYDDVIADLRDLNAQEAHIRAAIPAPQGAEAIGWLYCAEGSNLGAAFLFKDAQNNLGYNENHGARHLAPPHGRTRQTLARVCRQIQPTAAYRRRTRNRAQRCAGSVCVL